jgi:DNA repair protein RecN (Recombination protein N)
MLVGLSIRDIVLIEKLDLVLEPGLTVLTGETGAGKSILLDSLGLALGARGDSGLVRTGASLASATALFNLPVGHPAYDLLAEKGLEIEPGEELVLRRQVGADGRSRAFVNDQAASVGVLKELGAVLVEIHGQHETVGLLDPKSHRGLLDAFAGVSAELAACRDAYGAMRSAREARRALEARARDASAEAETLAAQLGELDRLDPREGEEAALAEERAVLGAAEKALSDIREARQSLGGDELSRGLAQALRLLQRARERALGAGASEGHPVVARLENAAAAADRALVEAQEALAAVDSAAEAFEFDPARLEETEERLFALRAAARKLKVAVDDLPGERARIAAALRSVENAEADLADLEKAEAAAEKAYLAAAEALSKARAAAGARLSSVIAEELVPLKLDKAKFRVAVEPQGLERAGAEGFDRVVFEIATNPGAPFGPLNAIASGGELARFALALKAALAGRGEDAGRSAMIFDEVDQGVGGAVADAVGARLKRLAAGGQQVLVVTHSPQVAARGDQHWKIHKSERSGRLSTSVETLDRDAREEEIARMLSGAEISEAARAAARSLLG